MNKSHKSTLPCALGAMVLVLTLAGLGGVARGQIVPITADGQGVSFQQDDYSFDNTSSDVSSTGQVSVDWSTLSAKTGITSGFLNVVNGTGWAVQNLPVNSALSEMSTAFNLGTSDGTADSSTSESVFFSSSPLTSAPAGTADTFTVTAQNYDAQGDGANRANPVAAPLAGAVNFQVGGLTKTAFEIGVPNVQAADNQCAPAAIANSLTFLKYSAGLNVPDPNVPGRGALAGTPVNPSNPTGATYANNGNGGTVVVPNGANSSTPFAPQAAPFGPLPIANYTTNETPGSSLVGTLDLMMGRNSSQRAEYFGTSTQDANNGNKWTPQDTNEGVGRTDIVGGLEKYLVAAGDANAVNIKYQNYSGGAIANPGIAGIAAPLNVSAQGFNFIYNQLAAGSAVEVSYNGGAGGHATEAVAAGYVLGVPWILLQSDLSQTDTDPNDNKIGNNGVLGQYGLEFGWVIPQAGNLTLQGISGTPMLGVDIAVAVPEPSSVLLMLAATLTLLSPAVARRLRS